MQNEVFQNISKIIERDSKSTTYKFALLRGVIDIIQDNSPYVAFSGDRAHIPTGLLIGKWMLYYYPILESPILLPQINGSAKLAFRDSLKKIILAYESKGGFSAFYNELRNNGIPPSLQDDFIALAEKLCFTITRMPMKYTGRSFNKNFYSIFHYSRAEKRKNTSRIDIEYLIQNFGTFSIPIDYYDAFKVLGSFISGQDSLLFKWAEFSVNASGKTLPIENVIHEVLRSPITEREITGSKKIYQEVLKQKGSVHCVWTGKKLPVYDIDHMIPFSVWKNNDLWNLLPSDSETNRKKRNKIPSPALIEKRKDQILYYWSLLNEAQSQRFKKELQVALLGNEPFNAWQQTGILKLQQSCEYLISNRGYEEWMI